MRLFLFFITLALTTLSCQKEQHFDPFIVDKSLPFQDSIKLLSKQSELKLFNTEIPESRTRTAFIVQTAYYSKGAFFFDDYKCKTAYQKDTLNIRLNNNNGYFGNGILIKVFNNQFYIKDIDPKTLKGEEKYIKTRVVSQKLILNNSRFKKNDSIYGFVDYKCSIDSLVQKHFKGYFKTIIQ